MKTMNYIKIFLVAALSTVLMVSCNEDSGLEESVVLAPTITSFEPSTGVLGDEIMVYGTGLSTVTAATLGGGDVYIKYRIDDTIIVLEVVEGSRDGVITVSKASGDSDGTMLTATSSSSFDVDHTLVPVIDQVLIPAQDGADEYDMFAPSATQVALEGSNLNVITSVSFGDFAATIILQREDELVFEVPLVDETGVFDMNISYYNGSASTMIDVSSFGEFFVLLPEPMGYEESVPLTLAKYATVTLEGFYLNLFNSLWVEASDGSTVSMVIKSQSYSSITLDIATSFYDASFTGALKGIYNSETELTLAESIELTANPYEHRYAGKSNLWMDIRTNSGGTDTSFLDLSDYVVYDACAVEAGNLLGSTDVMVYHKGLTYLQMRSPASMTGTLKNFSCTDTSIAANAFAEGTDVFYSKYTYFWVLDVTGETYSAHKTFLDAFLDGENAEDATGIPELSAAYFASIGLTLEPTDLTTGTYYGPSIYNDGSVGVSVDYGLSTADITNYPYMIVYSADDDRYGVIKLTDSVSDASYMLDVTFDLWY